ncbi:MAG: hypothetical protein ACTSPV_07070, partial [Candidatus Hodarchaeales archaeon]
SQVIATGLSSTDGFLDFVLPLGNYSFEFQKESYSGFTSVTLHQSTIIDIVHIVKYCGIMTLKLTNQYYQNLNHAYVQIQNFPLGTSSKGFTNANGEISFRGIPWGNYSVHVTLGTEIFPSFELIFDNEQLYYEIEFEMLNPILNTNGYSWQRNSVFSVVLSSEFVSGFLKSSLSVFTTTFASLIIIIAVLSLLSIASVISHPIVANKQILWTFQQLGSSKVQVIIGVVSQLTILGAIASLLGSLIGMFLMVLVPSFSAINVGGVVIQPRIDLLLLTIIIFSNSVVIILKAAQKTWMLYNVQRYINGVV